jgi:hypothetical protein
VKPWPPVATSERSTLLWTTFLHGRLLISKGDNETERKLIAEAMKVTESIDLPAGTASHEILFIGYLEFPEVFEHGGFDGITSNPPFLGGRNITSAISKSYNDTIHFLFSSPGTSCDLCSYFLLRGAQIISKTGHWGSIAVETIASGKTGENGLNRITQSGFSLTHARKSVQWPGHPNRKVAIIHFSKVQPRICVLDNKEVKKILSNLTESSGFDWSAEKLLQNEKRCFQGITVNGKEFILSETEFQKYVEEDQIYSEVLTPYITGNDLNRMSSPKSSSYLINFHGMDEYQAQEYPKLYEFLERNVKKKRTSIQSRKDVSEKWWSLQRLAPEMEQAANNLERVLCRTRYGALHCLTFTSKQHIFSDGIIVFTFSDFGTFALLQSDVHLYWALQQGSPRGKALRYKIKTCFETFPFPTTIDSLDALGKDLFEIRQLYMEKMCDGLTGTYNAIHQRDITSVEIQNLRDIHVEVNRAVVSAYAWDDLNLSHGFHETMQGVRFTISEEARREVLQRLLKLNKERYEEEVTQGLHDKKKAKKTSTRRKKKKLNNKNARQIDLFSSV